MCNNCSRQYWRLKSAVGWTQYQVWGRKERDGRDKMWVSASMKKVRIKMRGLIVRCGDGPNYEAGRCFGR